MRDHTLAPRQMLCIMLKNRSTQTCMAGDKLHSVMLAIIAKYYSKLDEDVVTLYSTSFQNNLVT